jgi:hypothetical protein
MDLRYPSQRRKTFAFYFHEPLSSASSQNDMISTSLIMMTLSKKEIGDQHIRILKAITIII